MAAAPATCGSQEAVNAGKVRAFSSHSSSSISTGSAGVTTRTRGTLQVKRLLSCAPQRSAAACPPSSPSASSQPSTNHSERVVVVARNPTKRKGSPPTQPPESLDNGPTHSKLSTTPSSPSSSRGVHKKSIQSKEISTTATASNNTHSQGPNNRSRVAAAAICDAEKGDDNDEGAGGDCFDLFGHSSSSLESSNPMRCAPRTAEPGGRLSDGTVGRRCDKAVYAVCGQIAASTQTCDEHCEKKSTRSAWTQTRYAPPPHPPNPSAGAAHPSTTPHSVAVKEAHSPMLLHGEGGGGEGVDVWQLLHSVDVALRMLMDRGKSSAQRDACQWF